MVAQIDRLAVLPLSAKVNTKGHLVIGGCDTVELAKESGTPLYLFDEFTLRSKIAELKAAFGKRYPGTTIIYACKAFINKAMAALVKEEGLGLDVVSGGELGIARSAGFPLDKVYFHGNNKSAEELGMALEWGVGRIVVDNFHELKMLSKMAREKGCTADILLRISPDVDPHTHQYTITGNVDSKFGFPRVNGEETVKIALSLPNLNLVGLHFHIGSLIFEVEPYVQSTEFILTFAYEMKRKYGFELKELDVGGGFGVKYTLESQDTPVSTFAETITSTIIERCRKLRLARPKLIIEPGRYIVAQAGVALYTVGAVKEIPGVRWYVSVDGGMGDNIRPALYGSKLEAVMANRMKDRITGKFTIAGKFCESGDVLIKDIGLPEPVADDILAVAGCGAYSIPQASNYNASFYPPIVMVNRGKVHLIRRRQTLEDLTACDLI
jgi:diaminopimelate decarboxylase